jgi:hypothetical protein
MARPGLATGLRQQMTYAARTSAPDSARTRIRKPSVNSERISAQRIVGILFPVATTLASTGRSPRREIRKHAHTVSVSVVSEPTG